MESKVTNLNSLQTKTIELEKTSSKMSLSEVFAERRSSYLNEFTLYIAHFNTIPNCITEIQIDCKKANTWFAETYKTEIKEHHFGKNYLNGSKIAELDDIFYIIYDDLLVYFDTNCSNVIFLFRKTEIKMVESVISN